MRKTAMLALIIGILTLLCSCFAEKVEIVDKDHRKAKEMIEVVLKAVQSEDEEQIRALFSESVLLKVESFDVFANELFDYYEGKAIFYDDGAGPFVETTNDEGTIYQLMESSFTVKTELNVYRFAMQYITIGSDEDVGLTSLYVIKKQEDKNLDYVYWGDGLFLPGIHVAVPNEK